MDTTYQLMESLMIEYEWNRGPMPSGYAQLRLRLQPDHPSEEAVRVISPPGRIWRVRPTEYSRKQDPHEVEREIDSFMTTIIEGVREGVKYALVHSLDQPVSNVIVVLEEVTVDPMYSTKMAFHIAARSAIEQLLTRAVREGLLRVIPGN